METRKFLRIGLVLWGIGLAGLGKGQSKAAAVDFFERGDYEEAGKIYEALLRRSPRDGGLNFYYGRCLQELGKEGAEGFLLEAERRGVSQSSFYLGKLYFKDYKFEESVKKFEDADERDYPSSDDKEEWVARAKAGAEMMRRVEKIEFLDSLVVDKQHFLEYYNISNEVGRLVQKGGSVNFENERGTRRISAVRNGGSYDLFNSFKTLEEWSMPVEIGGKVNSDGEENYPFLASDGVTLYFASNRSGGLGGLDIYVTRSNEGGENYLEPMNLGFPFNSPANDYMLVIDESANVGWFATDRFQEEDSVVIYQFVPKNAKSCYAVGDVSQEKLRGLAQFGKVKNSSGKGIHRRGEVLKSGESDVGGEKFFIKYGVEYENARDFKSEDTKRRFIALREMRQSAERIKAELEGLRQRYFSLESEEQKELRGNILDMEERWHEAMKSASAMERELRDAELKLVE